MTTSYALVRLVPSGDVYAIRYHHDAAEVGITGYSGPLHHSEHDAPLDEYDYEADPDALDQWNGPAQQYAVIREYRPT